MSNANGRFSDDLVLARPGEVVRPLHPIDRSSPEYISGREARRKRIRRDPTRPLDWLAGYDTESKSLAKWDESQHPRHPAGDDRGGEFAPAGGSITHGSPWEGTVYRGEGRTKDKTDEPGVYAGSAHGAGTYYGLEREVAERFSRPGTVRESTVRVERPYVVRSDADVTWMRGEASRAAGSPIDSDYASLLDGPQGRALARGLRSLGYDSVIVDYRLGAGGRQLVVLAE